MDVLPELLGEAEFFFFSPSDYKALGNVLNDVLAQKLDAYVNNPLANRGIVNGINNYLGSSIESLTLHILLRNNGTLDLIHNVVPETLGSASVDLDNIIEKLTFLNDNFDKVLTTIPRRSKADWQNFYSSISGILRRMRDTGVDPTYPDILERLESNKFVFYVPNEQERNTGINIISSRKRQWTSVLRGAQYRKYCDAEGINQVDRRRF